LDEPSASLLLLERGEELFLPSSAPEEVTSPQVRTTVNDNLRTHGQLGTGSLLVVPVCISFITMCKYVFRRLKATKILKTRTFSTIWSSSVVYDVNLHTTWFCSIKLIPRGTVSQ